MIALRAAGARGMTKLDWLDSKHSFSFADYYDESHMEFGPLRVINEDVIGPGQGFGSHPHKDMEIITYVIEGALEHKDSLGTGAVINSGEVQRMSAGVGVVHSEFNHSQTAPVHLLQIWIIPDRRGLAAGYEQKKIDLLPNQWVLFADRAGDLGALTIHQDVRIVAARVSRGSKLSYSANKRALWLQVVKGSISLGNLKPAAGDGLAITDEPTIEIAGLSDSEVLMFDLPAV